VRENFEVITTLDKAKRDEMFQFFRREGNEQEKQVVKFSGVEPVMDGDKQLFTTRRYSLTGRPQRRPIFRSTWSVAYPKEAV
jgi:hypothetical protein